MNDAPRRLQELTREESLKLLASVSLGRIVFTTRALPTIRPVNHFVDNGEIIIRSHAGAGIVSAVDSTRGIVVAYEADTIDPHDHLGWSVIITGLARLLQDPADIARYQGVLRAWVAGPMDHVIRIHPELVTGFRLVEDHHPSQDGF